jgi:hypothetical protein
MSRGKSPCPAGVADRDRRESLPLQNGRRLEHALMPVERGHACLHRFSLGMTSVINALACASGMMP